MAMFRAYTVDSGLVALSGTSAIPVLYFATTSTNDANLFKFKVSCEGSASAAPPSNGQLFCAVCVVTGTVGGGGAVTPRQVAGGSTLAANTTFTSASSAALTGLTQGNEYWPNTIPLTSGAQWADDDPNTGEELNLANSTKWCVYVTPAVGSGTNMNVRAVLSFAE